MKKLFSILSIAFIAMTVHGQDLSIGILVPGEEQGFSAAQSDLLQNRLERLCTDGGIAVVNAPDGFFLYPAVSIVSDEVAEGGMRNINVIKAEVTLSVRRIGGDVGCSCGPQASVRVGLHSKPGSHVAYQVS